MANIEGVSKEQINRHRLDCGDEVHSASDTDEVSGF